MKYNIVVPGDDYVYVNGLHKVSLESFIQTLRDVNKSKKFHCPGYAGE